MHSQTVGVGIIDQWLASLRRCLGLTTCAVTLTIVFGSLGSKAPTAEAKGIKGRYSRDEFEVLRADFPRVPRSLAPRRGRTLQTKHNKSPEYPAASGADPSTGTGAAQ